MVIFKKEFHLLWQFLFSWIIIIKLWSWPCDITGLGLLTTRQISSGKQISLHREKIKCVTCRINNSLFMQRYLIRPKLDEMHISKSNSKSSSQANAWPYLLGPVCSVTWVYVIFHSANVGSQACVFIHFKPGIEESYAGGEWGAAESAVTSEYLNFYFSSEFLFHPEISLKHAWNKTSSS